MSLFVGHARIQWKPRRRCFVRARLMDGATHSTSTVTGKGSTRESALAAALGFRRVNLLNRDADLELCRADASGREFRFIAAGDQVEVF